MLSSLSRNLNVQNNKSTCKCIVLTRTFYLICSILQTYLQTNSVGTYIMFQVRIHVQYFQVLNLVAVQIKSQFTTNNMKNQNCSQYILKLLHIQLVQTINFMVLSYSKQFLILSTFATTTNYSKNIPQMFEEISNIWLLSLDSKMHTCTVSTFQIFWYIGK